MNHYKLLIKILSVLTLTLLVSACSGGGGSSGSSGGDTTAPSIITLTPTDDNTTVDATADLSMVFNESLNVVAGKSFIIYKTDGNVEHTNFDVSVVQVDGNGTDTITVNPNSHLVYGAAHYVKIDAGAFQDAAGNNYSGIADTTTWNFSVASNSGPCGCDDFDNCDLPASLQ